MLIIRWTLTWQLAIEADKINLWTHHIKANIVAFILSAIMVELSISLVSGEADERSA
jgi:hypothetical protein